jgi:glycosyltransferase involved in cell wall biosynthesis
VTAVSGVHQFHSGTAYGDAVTNQMLALQHRLRSLGYASEVFAEHVAPELSDRVRSIRTYPGSPGDLLIVHHSIGHHAFDDVVALPNPIVTIFHNVTPEQYFEDSLVRSFIRLGRDQLRYLARRSLFGLAVSNFNRLEMASAGFDRVDVLPVRTEFREFEQAGAASDPTGRDWLYVGRVVANKCQHRLVEAFAAYQRTFDPTARLHLVGDLSEVHYVELVEATAGRLGVSDRVVFTGKVSDRGLLAAFAGAGVFVSLSEHEGFGVPILEAMAARVPVVAYGSTAVPETMGGAGIVLRTQDAATVAATVQALFDDKGLRWRLVERQLERVAQVASFDVDAALQRVVDRAGGAHPPLEVQVQGPFETSYSLATMNRHLAEGLSATPGLAVSIYATEGPGDYVPAQADVDRHPTAAALYRRAASVPYPDVVIRQMWPPRLNDSPGAVTCQYFGWEESRIPDWMADDFNRHLDGIGVMSTFVRDVVRDSGVDVPVAVVGNGVDLPDPDATVEAPELATPRGFTFLHVSSAFPRKGVDLLLDAYFATFDGSDDVTLVLKTFPNPHNEVGAVLERLRSGHPDPPDVRWIDRDLTEHEIHGLYNLADALVHPARGEGFGLPVAEAMLAGIPVISVAYSGLADFVSDDTAVCIPFTLGPARTHFDIPRSEWAEPDRGALGEAMAALAADPTAPAVVARVERARRLIATEYSWGAATARWEAFLADVVDESKPVAVAMVSTWNSRCGIAENTRYLVEHSPDRVSFELFADRGAELIDPSADAGVVRTWHDRWTPDLDELEAALALTDADVVHVQFNFGFFEFGHLAEVLERQMARRGVVLTMHRTLDYDDRGDLLTLRQIQPTLARVDRLIVHQESDRRYLADQGLVDNVRLVPLGASAPPDITPDEVRARLGLGDRPVVGTFGFLLPHKGTLDLVQAVAELRDEFPDILLLAACASYPHTESKEYEDEIRAQVAARGMEDNVLLLTDYLPDETARVLLLASQVIVLPYHDTGESSSAALRFILPLGRPVVVTDQRLFDDAADSLLVVRSNDVAGIADGVRRVLVDPELGSDLADRARQGSMRFRWDRVVADHRRIYAEVRRSARDRLARRGESREPVAAGVPIGG